MSKENISRFVQMYDEYYTQVEKELRYGRKESHWMWFIFPQITGLGRSSMAQFYAVKDIGEAKDFLKSSCGEKMRNLLQIVLPCALQVSDNRNPPNRCFSKSIKSFEIESCP